MADMNLGSASGMGGSLASLFEGIFNNAGAPYGDAMSQLQKYFQGAQGFQNPFYQAGTQGTQNYQNWLSGMQDPTKFINNTMNQYQASPYSQYLQQQAVRAGQNAASMGGLSNGQGGAGLGSSPFAQQLQQNAANISSQDMNQWLGNVLNVNQQYGQGQQNLMNTGQNAANSLTNLFSRMGENMGQLALGQGEGNQQNLSNIFSGLFGIGGSGSGNSGNNNFSPGLLSLFASLFGG